MASSIELETDFSRNPSTRGNREPSGTIEKPVDLEPYVDFLEEIEAFDCPKKPPADYPSEFVL